MVESTWKQDRAIFEVEITEIAETAWANFFSPVFLKVWPETIIEYIEGALKHDRFLDFTLEPLNQTFQGWDSQILESSSCDSCAH